VIETSKIIRAVSELSKGKAAGERWIVPLDEKKLEGRNHFVLFLKPEVLAVAEGVDVEAILDLVMSALRKHNVSVGAVRVLNGPYLGRYNIMEEHYGVINRASRLGERALSDATRKKLLDECPGVARILGGHEFLKEFPGVSAFALYINSDTVR
jgi:hypothetical protein